MRLVVGHVFGLGHGADVRHVFEVGHDLWVGHGATVGHVHRFGLGRICG